MRREVVEAEVIAGEGSDQDDEGNNRRGGSDDEDEDEEAVDSRSVFSFSFSFCLTVCLSLCVGMCFVSILREGNDDHKKLL